MFGTFVIAVRNLRVPYNAGYFLIRWGPLASQEGLCSVELGTNIELFVSSLSQIQHSPVFRTCSSYDSEKNTTGE
jgi:hypothetical protein